MRSKRWNAGSCRLFGHSCMHSKLTDSIYGRCTIFGDSCQCLDLIHWTRKGAILYRVYHNPLGRIQGEPDISWKRECPHAAWLSPFLSFFLQTILSRLLVEMVWKTCKTGNNRNLAILSPPSLCLLYVWKIADKLLEILHKILACLHPERSLRCSDDCVCPERGKTIPE